MIGWNPVSKPAMNLSHEGLLCESMDFHGFSYPGRVKTGRIYRVPDFRKDKEENKPNLGGLKDA